MSLSIKKGATLCSNDTVLYSLCQDGDGTKTGVISPPSGGPLSSSSVSTKSSMKKSGVNKKIIVCPHSKLMSFLLQRQLGLATALLLL
jgi:hypothetical protein